MLNSLSVPVYLRVSKTLDERIKRYLAADPSHSAETLIRIGLFIHAMPDGATIVRRRGVILGVESEPKNNSVNLTEFIEF